MTGVDRIRILVLETAPETGSDVSSAARELGYDVVATCASGEEALDRYEELQPDLVLTDIPLEGELDGIETAHQLHERGHVAVVYVTACADLETVARARETQPHGYLLKPFTQDELRLAIEVAATRYLEDGERRRREQSYFEAFQSLSDGVIAADLAGVVVFMNAAAEHVTGWSSQDAVGHSLNEVFRIFELNGESAEVQIADLGGQTDERTVWLTRRDGERVAVQDRTAAMRDQRNSLTGLIILFRQLPELPAEELEESEVPEGMDPLDEAGVHDHEEGTFHEERVHEESLSEASVEDEPSQEDLVVMETEFTGPPDEVEPVEEIAEQDQSAGMPEEEPELMPSAEVAPVEAPPPGPEPEATVPPPLPPRPPAPTPPPAPASPAPLVDVVESISDPLIAIDGRWNLVFANGSAGRLFERPSNRLLGSGFWELFPPAVREAHHEALAHAMLHRQAVNREVYCETSRSWLELRGYPFAEGLLLLIKDITARRDEADRRSRMDRLESLGLLARGFAHDFNNLLTVLLGNLSLAEMRLRGKNGLPELTTAKQATLQAQSLVQQLLTFARGGAPIKRQTKLDDLIEAFFNNHTHVPGMEYEREIADALPEMGIDPAQIRRLLSNLVRNAEQAQPEGGSITLRCYVPEMSEIFPDEGPGEEGSASSAPGVVIEVQDRGEGIAPDSLSHIFEPYFSTRKAQNATGLGLTVCESIAKAHGGSISVRSEQGDGTTVRFYLPIDSDSEEVDAFGIATQEEPAIDAASPRILVLEDDPLVSSLISRNLTSQGFEVVETPEGSETVKAYQEAMGEERPFDLVILDLSIPNGMGGVRTMEKLRGIDPDVVAIVSSGYSDDPVMAKPAAYGFTAVLPKPYEPNDMLRLVNTVLNSKGLRSAK